MENREINWSQDIEETRITDLDDPNFGRTKIDSVKAAEIVMNAADKDNNSINPGNNEISSAHLANALGEAEKEKAQKMGKNIWAQDVAHDRTVDESLNFDSYVKDLKKKL